MDETAAFSGGITNCAPKRDGMIWPGKLTNVAVKVSFVTLRFQILAFTYVGVMVYREAILIRVCGFSRWTGCLTKTVDDGNGNTRVLMNDTARIHGRGESV